MSDDSGTMRLWIVYEQYSTNKIDRVAAFFSEQNARGHVAKLVGGKDSRDVLIGLETIEVLDEPPSRAAESS